MQKERSLKEKSQKKHMEKREYKDKKLTKRCHKEAKDGVEHLKEEER